MGFKPWGSAANLSPRFRWRDMKSPEFYRRNSEKTMFTKYFYWQRPWAVTAHPRGALIFALRFFASVKEKMASMHRNFDIAARQTSNC